MVELMALALVLETTVLIYLALRVRELKATLGGAFSRKDGLCAIAKVSAGCYRRLLDGRRCIAAERASSPPLLVLVDELKRGKKRLHPRTKAVTDLRGDGVQPAAGPHAH